MTIPNRWKNKKRSKPPTSSPRIWLEDLSTFLAASLRQQHYMLWLRKTSPCGLHMS